MKKKMVAIIALSAIAGCSLLAGCAALNNKSKYIIEELYHDQGYVYMSETSPTSSDEVTYRLRAEKGNLRSAWLCFTMDVKELNASNCTYNRVAMQREREDESGYYEYWVCTLPAQSGSYSYHFECENDLEYIWYDATQEVNIDAPIYRSSDWLVLVDYSTPEWTQGAIWYSMMPDSFNNGDVTNDKQYQESFSDATSGTWTTVTQMTWGNTHFSANDWFGGDLDGITEKNYYLQSMEIDSLQINPIWYTNHNAGYGAYDLTMIDSAFGNADSMHTLIDGLHDNGIKISLDAVLQYYVATGKISDAADIFPIDITEDDDLTYTIVYDENGEIVAGRWGNDIDFSSKAARDWLYAQPTSLIQLYLTEYDIDCWRMDVGAMLSGTEAGNWDNAYQILNDIRKYVKGISEDIGFISETITSSVGLSGLPSDILTSSGTIDSFWNYNYTDPVRLWASGTTTVGALASNIYNGVVRLPRDMANSSYNSLSTHDRSRIYQECQNYESLLAATLLNFTFVGSPVIYYGDEIGMEGDYYPWLTGGPPSGFGSFDWTESEWDYYIYNYYRNLINLRKTYKNTFTTGTFIELEVNEGQNYYAFGRINTDGKVMVVLNQNTQMIKGVTLDAKKLSIKDGMVVTDWISGQSYTVKDGKIKVDVLPGGAALAIGQGGNFVERYELIRFGVDYTKTEWTEENVFTVNGTSNLTSAWDTAEFAAIPVFNNASVSAKINGSAALMIRNTKDTDSAYYAALINKGTLEIWARFQKGETAKKIYMRTIKDSDVVKIERTNGNVCVLSINGEVIAESSMAMPTLSYQIFAGFAANDGKGTITDLQVQNEEECAYVGFENGYGSVFASNEKAVFENGYAKLKNTELITEGKYVDFSIKANLTFQPTNNSDYAGVMIGKDGLDSFVSVGKMQVGGIDYYYAGITTNETIVIYGKVPCLSDGAFEVQVEKVGAFYYARYKDETTNNLWVEIPANGLYANYSDINCGIVARGSSEAIFDWYARGNASEDNYQGMFAGAQYGEIKIEDDRELYKAYAQYKIAAGEWEYVENGWATKSVMESLMYLTGEYMSFRTNVTLCFDEITKNGYIDFVFGSDKGKVSDKAAKFRLYDSGLYEIYDGNIIRVSGEVDFFADSERFVFECVDGLFTVYCGEDVCVLTSVMLENYSGGYMMFASNTKYSILNPGVTNNARNVTTYKGTIGVKNQRLILNATTTTYAHASVTSVSLSDFIIGTNVHLTPTGKYVEAYGGILFGSRVGALPEEDGYYVSINSDNEICLYNGETLLAMKQVSGLHHNSLYLILVVQNGVIKVYADAYMAENQVWTQEPIITYDVGYSIGGALNFYCKNGLFDMANLSIYGLQPNEDYTKLTSFTNRKVTEPVINEPNVTKDFVTEDKTYAFDSAGGLAEWNRYNGMTTLITDENGNYTGGIEIDGTGNWFAGVASAAGQYENYEITVTMKLDAAAGWAGLSLNKSSYAFTHERAGILLFAQYIDNGTKARITFYDTEARGAANGITLNAGESSYGYFTFTVRCLNGILEVFNGTDTSAEPLGMFNVKESTIRPNAFKGYLSLVAGNTTAWFKSVSIHIL